LCSILFLVANGLLQLHKMYQSWCTAKNSWWWAENLPETCRVIIPIKLEFSASVGFIHKESVTMHGHTIVKNKFAVFRKSQNPKSPTNKYVPSTITHFSAWDLRSSWMSGSFGWQLIIDVSENICVLFSTVNQLKCLPTPCNIPEERKPQLRCGGSNQSPISSSHTLKNKLPLVNNSINWPNTRRDYKEKQQID
jgi:hypothetical protein